MLIKHDLFCVTGRKYVSSYNAEIFVYKGWRPMFLLMSQSALSASFEYFCYGSTTIINILILSVRGSTSDVRFLIPFSLSHVFVHNSVPRDIESFQMI